MLYRYWKHAHRHNFRWAVAMRGWQLKFKSQNKKILAAFFAREQGKGKKGTKKKARERIR